MKEAIQVKNIVKVYNTPVRDVWWRQLIHRKKEKKEALKGVTFDVKKGEFIGLVGPNGAGKTTLLKILAGILFPDSGTVSVVGHHPFKKEASYLKRISFIMGQRYQLMWELPALDSYVLHRLIYDIPQKVYSATLNELTDLLDAHSIVKKPVKTLSLGERMKVELIGSLLHRPEILFMDEPTLGLDVIAQNNVVDFLKKYQKQYRPAIIFTSHYMRDVERLADRILLISSGTIVYDGPLPVLLSRFTSKRIVSVTLSQPLNENDVAYVTKKLHGTYTFPLLQIPAEHGLQSVLPWVLDVCSYDDIDIGREPIEITIERLFRSYKSL
jgi:ABC-2 type transport system ATP-binding protein